MANLRRVVVGLRTHDTFDKPRVADFLTCLVNHFSPNELSSTVNCKIEDDFLLLYTHDQDCGKTCDNEYINQSVAGSGSELGPVTLHHSPECPVWKVHGYYNNVTTPQNKGIYVGVSVILESSDSYVLMTQRPDHMRTFPRAWVPPGGHLEVGEHPIQGALRELEEEVGLVLDPSNCSTDLFCLWESVFPPLLAVGEPRSHHVVLYFLAKSSETWQQLQAKIKVDPKEVKACTWLTRDNVRSLQAGPKGKPELIQQFVVGDDGELHSAELNLHRMFYTDMWITGQIYTGSQLALTKWMESQSEMLHGQIPSKI